MGISCEFRSCSWLTKYRNKAQAYHDYGRFRHIALKPSQEFYLRTLVILGTEGGSVSFFLIAPESEVIGFDGSPHLPH